MDSSLQEEISDIFDKEVTSEMLERFANSLSPDEIDRLTGDHWNKFMVDNFGNLDVYLEGVAEGGGEETSWNNMLKSYRTIG